MYHPSEVADENSAAEMELNEKQRLEYEILKAAIEKEKSTPYQCNSAATQRKSREKSSTS